MSYILDALKKSEQQRDNGKIPDVQTVHSSNLNYHNGKKAIWPYILITAIILNLIAIIYFIVDKRSEKSIAVAKDDISILKQVGIPAIKEENNIGSQTKNPETTRTNEKFLMQASATPKQKSPSSNNETAEVKKVNPPVAALQKDIIDYYDLPESLRRQIPSITVSAHIYSSNPLQRSIVINNSFLEEGDYVLDDLTLHEITSDGAIFDFDGIRFHYDVVTGWQ